MIRIHNPLYVPFLHQTRQLRHAGTLCDTLLTVEGLSFEAHALILTLASKHFRRHLTNQQRPGPAYYCAIESIPPHTFKQILDYVYSESVEVPRDDLKELLKGAEYLEIESLVEQCQAQLKDTTSSTKTDTTFVQKAKKDTLLSNTNRSKEDTGESSPQEDHYFIRKHHSKPVPNPPKTYSSTSPLLPLISKETIITSNASSSTSHLPWAPLSGSRSIMLNCSEIMAFHSLRAYPYPMSMYPLLQRSLQPQVSSTIMGYTGMVHPYHPLFHTPPLTQESTFIRGLKEKRGFINASSTASMADQDRKPKVQAERETCCKQCGKSTLENPWRMSNGPSALGSGEMTFRCKFCAQGEQGKRSLQPLRRAVEGEKPYQCKHCSKRFSLKHQLDTHHRIHTGEKPFECRLCGQRSRDYSAMIKHLRTHGGATPYQCTLCLEFCSSLASMQKHLKNHPSQDFPADWSLSSTYLYNCHT